MAQEYTPGIFGQGGALMSGLPREIPLSASVPFETLNGGPLSLSCSVNVSGNITAVQSVAVTASANLLLMSSSIIGPSNQIISASLLTAQTSLLYNSGNLNVQGSSSFIGTCSFGFNGLHNNALPVTVGGTGLTTLTNDGVLVGQGANAVLAITPPTLPAVLTSLNGSASPAWTGSVSFTSASAQGFTADGNSANITTLTAAIPAASQWLLHYVIPTSNTAGSTSTWIYFSATGLSGATYQMSAVAYGASSATTMQIFSSTNPLNSSADWFFNQYSGDALYVVDLWVNNALGTAGTLVPVLQNGSSTTFIALPGATLTATRYG